MPRTLLLTCVAAAIAAGNAFAVEPGPGAQLGTTAAEIVAALAAQGYDVTKYERERGKIEVYALKDGRRYELKIDPESGEILQVEDER